VIRLAAAAGAATLAGTSLVAQIAAPAPRRGAPMEQSPRTALRAGPVSLPQRVAEEVARTGRVRVIIGLSVSFAPEGLLQAADRVQQRTEIAVAQDALASALAAFQVTDLKRFRFIPGMAAEVDGGALQMLTSLPQVAYIEADELAAPTLAQSTALVGAPTVWGNGYTGAGQDDRKY
jgi:hypothetical protein